MRVLCIDAYDSYTHNLVALFQDSFRERRLQNGKETDEIITIHHDACQLEELCEYLSCFDAVVLSPGPGNPNIKEDARLIGDVCSTNTIPLLGVCFGMQSLVLAHGGSILQMRQAKHGTVSRINHSGEDLFLGVPTVCYGTRYHSLHVDVADIPAKLQPLAFASSDKKESPCLMAFRHKFFPHWGVQYHPDSICSTHGLTIVRNFLNMAVNSNIAQDRLIKTLPAHFKARFASSPSAITSLTESKQDTILKFATVQADIPININTLYHAICQGDSSHDFALLDSAAAPGKWTYLSCVSKGMFRINYTAYDQTLKDTRRSEPIQCSMEGAWKFLNQNMQDYKLATDSPESPAPFCGGFIGWFSYEAGLSTMGLEDIKSSGNVSDIALLFIERSIALDVVSNTIYVHSIAPNDEQWVKETTVSLKSKLSTWSSEVRSCTDRQAARVVRTPSKQDYLNKIEKARAEMRQGNSYEICLTDQTAVDTKTQDPWQLYLDVRQNNPAPYATFLRLGKETLIGSSPEMFLRCEENSCEMRPIKGTLKKTKDIDLEKAQKLLANEKDKAENLMIVDLLRNDLHQVADVGSVRVLQLMAVEEYATVFQLVSSIVGQVTAPFSGLDVLARTLPPGSMTGAPKRKTCEILQRLEGRPRGAYSGVAGYWSVNDNHLWSVIIRSAYQGRNESLPSSHHWRREPTSAWTVGAGGALLTISSPEAEWQEMITKASSVINGLLPRPCEFDLLEAIFFDDSSEDSSPLWKNHLARLERTCSHFDFITPDEKAISQLIQLKKIPGKQQKVRLMYQRSGQVKMECQVLSPMPEFLNVRLDSVATMIQDFDFVRYKTTVRQHYNDARDRTGTKGLDEVLLYDQDENLMEGSIFNIAIWKYSKFSNSGAWVTPPSSICLGGVMREQLLRQGRIIEGNISKSELKMGQKIMLFNAVRGVCWGFLVTYRCT